MPTRPRRQGAAIPAIVRCVAVTGLVACGTPALPPATGSSDEVLLVIAAASSVSVDALAAVLASPAPDLVPEEPLFRTRLGGTEPPRDKNVIVVASNTATGALFRAVRGALAPDAAARVDAGIPTWCVLRDVWARGQEVSLLTGPLSGLDSLVLHTAAAVRHRLEESTLARTAAVVGAETTTVDARRLRPQYGFSIAVPPSFRIVEHPDAVELVAAAPTRSVTIVWRDATAAPDDNQQGMLLDWQRDTLAHLHGDALVESTCRFAREPTELVLRGVWENRADVAGGPLVTHFVYDANRRRLYGVQGQLFAPGRRKRAAQIEVEALLRSFRLESAP